MFRRRPVSSRWVRSRSTRRVLLGLRGVDVQLSPRVLPRRRGPRGRSDGVRFGSLRIRGQRGACGGSSRRRYNTNGFLMHQDIYQCLDGFLSRRCRGTGRVLKHLKKDARILHVHSISITTEAYNRRTCRHVPHFCPTPRPPPNTYLSRSPTAVRACNPVPSKTYVWAIGSYNISQDVVDSRECYDAEKVDASTIHPSAVTKWTCQGTTGEEPSSSAGSSATPAPFTVACGCATPAPSVAGGGSGSDGRGGVEVSSSSPISLAEEAVVFEEEESEGLGDGLDH